MPAASLGEGGGGKVDRSLEVRKLAGEREREREREVGSGGV